MRRWPCCRPCRPGGWRWPGGSRPRVDSGQHDPRRRQRLLAAQPTDRRSRSMSTWGPRPSRSGTGPGSWTPCLGCGAGANIASSTATSSTGWCASPGRSRSTAYRDAMFPTSRFRMAYDLLKDRRPGRVVKDYLAVLLLAAQEGESRVDEALRLLLDKGQSPDTDAVTEALHRGLRPSAVTDVSIEDVDLTMYDRLLRIRRRIMNENPDRPEDSTDRQPQGASSAGDAGRVRGGGPIGPAGIAELRALPAGVDRAGMPGAAWEPDRAIAAGFAAAAWRRRWGRLDLKRLPVKVVQQVRALLDGTFADRRENVLAFGNPGSGKTHVLSAISHELIRSGRRVYFRNCGLMVQDLLAAKRDLKLSGSVQEAVALRGPGPG